MNGRRDAGHKQFAAIPGAMGGIARLAYTRAKEAGIPLGAATWPLAAGAAGRPSTAHRRAHDGRRKRSRGEGSFLRVHASATGGRNVRMDLRWAGAAIGHVDHIDVSHELEQLARDMRAITDAG